MKKSKIRVSEQIRIAEEKRILDCYDKDMLCYICRGESGTISECERTLVRTGRI